MKFFRTESGDYDVSKGLANYGTIQKGGINARWQWVIDGSDMYGDDNLNTLKRLVRDEVNDWTD